MVRRGVAAFALLAGALAAHAGAAGPGPAEHVVWMVDNAFRDARTGTPITHARVGDTVVFVLVEGAHTATRGAAGASLAWAGGPDSPILSEPGEAHRHTLDAPGAIPYTCVLHSDMNGVVVAG